MGVRGGKWISESGKWMSDVVNGFQEVINGCMTWQMDTRVSEMINGNQVINGYQKVVNEGIMSLNRYEGVVNGCQ